MNWPARTICSFGDCKLKVLSGRVKYGESIGVVSIKNRMILWRLLAHVLWNIIRRALCRLFKRCRAWKWLLYAHNNAVFTTLFWLRNLCHMSKFIHHFCVCWLSVKVIYSTGRVKMRLHIAIGMQTRLQTGLQTGVSSVYTERLMCKPVCQPIVVTFTHDDWFAYRYAYRFANPAVQSSKHCLRIWPRPLESLVTQCLRRRNNSSCSLQMEDA